LYYDIFVWRENANALFWGTFEAYRTRVADGMLMDKESLVVKCPTCGKRVRYTPGAARGTFPFCSERCKLLDLGKWLNEEYKIETPLAGESAVEERGEDKSERDR